MLPSSGPDTMLQDTERERLQRLAAIAEIARRVGVASLSDEQLQELPRLYRWASTLYARRTRGGGASEESAELASLLVKAHGLLYARHERPHASWASRLWHFYRVEVPRSLRSEWRLLCVSFALVYGLALLSGLLVTRDLGLAYSLLDPHAVSKEIEQLQAAAHSGSAFRGNFSFGLGESPGTAGMLIGNNLRVALTFFALALVPPLYALVLTSNSLMLGTYTAVAGHWGQAGSISSILWCHGVLEIQAIVLAGSAGLVLLRPWVVAGVWSRRHAIRQGGALAWRLWAPVIPMLLAAGFIEAFVTPHAGLVVRLCVAIGSGLALLGWVVFSGRDEAEQPSAEFAH